jgi:hypothetical protein
MLFGRVCSVKSILTHKVRSPVLCQYRYAFKGDPLCSLPRADRVQQDHTSGKSNTEPYVGTWEHLARENGLTFEVFWYSGLARSAFESGASQSAMLKVLYHKHCPRRIFSPQTPSAMLHVLLDGNGWRLTRQPSFLQVQML